MKILLGSKEYLRAVDKDFQFGIGFKNNTSFYQSAEIIKVVDELNQFNEERNSTYDYVLYGKMEYLLDAKVNNSSYYLNQDNYIISIGYIDKFTPLVTDMINIVSVTADEITVNNTSVQINDVILISNGTTFSVRKVLDRNEDNGTIKIKLDTMTGVTSSSKIVPSTARYYRSFKEIINTDYLRIFNSAYSTNIFYDKIYQYNTYKNINTAGLKDNLNNPITSLYMRIKPKYVYTNILKSDLTTTIIDDSFVDIVSYDLNGLAYEVVDEVVATFKPDLAFYFKPYFNNPIRIMSSVVTDTNINNLFTMPDHGFQFANGDVLYKQLLDIGSFEDNVGLDYPFINNLHYVYNDMKFCIRRVVPIATYTDLHQLSNDEYADELVNDDVTNQRLC